MAQPLLEPQCQVGWEAASKCQAWGARDPVRDKGCDKTVAPTEPGRCVCAFAPPWNDSLVPQLEYGCGHAPLTCATACRTFARDVVHQSHPPRDARIPRIVHQSAASDQQISAALQPQVQAWLDLQPHGWAYRLTSARRARTLVQNKFPGLSALYTSLMANPRAGPLRDDLVRFMVLFSEGGLAASARATPTANFAADAQLFRASGSAARPCQVVLARAALATTNLTTDLMMSVPHHPFWLHVLRVAQRERRNASLAYAQRAAGPWAGSQLLTRAWLQYRSLTLAREYPVCVAPGTLVAARHIDAPAAQAACRQAQAAGAPAPASARRGLDVLLDDKHFSASPDSAQTMRDCRLAGALQPPFDLSATAAIFLDEDAEALEDEGADGWCNVTAGPPVQLRCPVQPVHSVDTRAAARAIGTPTRLPRRSWYDQNRPPAPRPDRLKMAGSIACGTVTGLPAKSLLLPGHLVRERLWPIPRLVHTGAGALPVGPQFRVHLLAPATKSNLLKSVLAPGAERFCRHIFARQAPPPTEARLLLDLQIVVAQPEVELKFNIDESYQLNVTQDGQAHLYAATVWGALHGLTTLRRAMASDERGWPRLPQSPMYIQDAPALPWRGSLADSARHFLPLHQLYVKKERKINE